MDPKSSPEGFLALLAAIGAVIGMGKLLVENKPFSMRLSIGRALVSGGLGASAGLILTAFPDASPVLLYGTAAGLASMGTSAIEVVLSKWIRKD
jgi:hypothetical protein